MSSAKVAKRPNILVIWGDDIGWQNVSAYGMGTMGYTTPNIDAIGYEGIRFTDHYAQQSCTAGRAAFITGQYPIRSGMVTVGQPGDALGLQPASPCLAEVLKQAGYRTGHFGKSHLGDRNEHLPTNHGFDEFFGNLYHLNVSEEDEQRDYQNFAKAYAGSLENYEKKFGARGVIHSWATDQDDSTEDPRFGRVGKQKIVDTGPLHQERMHDVDAAEFIPKALDSNHMGCLSNGSTGFPGTDGYMPFANGMLPEILRKVGYSTYCLGKWHLSPEETNTAAGPYDRWPLGRGFERFYGFLGGDTHQYYPELVHDNHQTEPPATPEQGYHLTPDLVERARSFIADAKQVAPDKPFFCYFALGAMHSPHHVPKAWADRYKGQFDDGWDAYRQRVFDRQVALGIVPPGTEISPPDPDVQDWSALGADERRLFARMMEVFAGFLEHTDHYIGELIAFLKDIGEYDNTLIMLISDNGSSAEGGPTGSVNECRFFNNVADTVADGLKHIDEIGGPTTFNHFPWGWTHAGNTPFRRWKRETYRGGSTDPFIVAWPRGIKEKGVVRQQYCHIIDMVPTVLDALGVPAPEVINGVAQSGMEGVSLQPTFDDADAAQVHHTQYFEMLGHRSLYHDGWRAVCPWPGTSFTASGRAFGDEITHDMLSELDADDWELYHVDEDFAETRNLAAQERERLIAMIGMWYVEAGRYNVLPIDSRGTQRIALERPRVAENQQRYTFYPNTQSVVAAAAPRTLNRPHSFVAEVQIPPGGADGVLLSFGGNDGGFTFYVQDNRLCYLHNYLALDYFYVKSDAILPEGAHLLGMQFEPTGKPDLKHGKGVPATVTLLLDGEPIAQGALPHTVPIRLGQGGALVVGMDNGAPVNPEYQPPFRYAGTLKRVIVDVSGEAVTDQQAEMRAYLRKQ